VSGDASMPQDSGIVLKGQGTVRIVNGVS